MQPVSSSPYRFSRPLGQCQVGTVWSAADELGRPLTVAVLSPEASRDQRWREAFAATVNVLAQQSGPDRPRFERSDFAAEAPWAAFAGAGGAEAGAERVFESLGMQVVPADPADTPPGSPVGFGLGSAHPISGTPMPPAGDDAQYDPYGIPSPRPGQDAFASPGRRIEPSAPRKKRTGVLIGAAIAVVVLLAGGGTWFLLNSGGDNPDPAPTASTGGAPVQAGGLPTAPPVSPGVEPPIQGKGIWPAKWPRYNPLDKVTTLNPEGLGFPVRVPPNWQCTLAGRAEGFIKYNCGTSPGVTPQAGGEITVRDCVQPCNPDRQTEMRKAEEAWGKRWVRSGPFSNYAEAILDLDGEQRHALVVVAYYRGDGQPAINKQVVLRMTAPVKDANQLRRFATYIHDTLVF